VKSFILTIKHLHNYFIVLQQRINIGHFRLKRKEFSEQVLLPARSSNFEYDLHN
jgi:hypothetical protein